VAKAKNNRKIVFFSVLAYFIFLIATFPLNVIYKLVDPKGLPVQVVAVSGTVWNGDITVKHKSTGQVNAVWQLNGFSLLMGSIDSSVQIKSTELNAELDASFGIFTQTINLAALNGYVQAPFVNRLLQRNKVRINGGLEISDLAVTYDLKQKYAQNAQGRVVWMGGNVNYPKGRIQGQANLPMLIADFSADSGQLNMDLHTDENLSVATASLKTDGWGSVSVLKRMIDIIGEPWPSKASADSSVFEISEKVL
jgi:general secretion pathway protein N